MSKSNTYFNTPTHQVTGDRANTVESNSTSSSSTSGAFTTPDSGPHTPIHDNSTSNPRPASGALDDNENIAGAKNQTISTHVVNVRSGETTTFNPLIEGHTLEQTAFVPDPDRFHAPNEIRVFLEHRKFPLHQFADLVDVLAQLPLPIAFDGDIVMPYEGRNRWKQAFQFAIRAKEPKVYAENDIPESAPIEKKQLQVKWKREHSPTRPE